MARTILIVDDNAVERTVLSGFLRSEYTVLAAHSGKEMLNVLRDMAKEISAIILDLIMPEMDGYEALRRIRENAVYRQIPVLVATSLMDTDSQVKALELGASGYTFKPYNRNLLLHLLENTISLREKSALVNASRRDALTGLPNRTTFFEDAEAMIKRAEPGYYILACFDIENFKVINDQYGSAAGDAVLRHVADAICAGITPLGGICCRYSADRFGLLYPAKYKDSDAIRALHEKAGQPDRLGRRIKIRLGRYTVDDPEVPVSAMYDRATLAEESIRGRYDTFIAEYSESMRTRLITQQKIVNNMDRALAEGEFEPWYQPQYNHATGALIGAEALVRWRQGDLFVPPADFVPVFERNGFIYEMDQYIWENVCRRLRQWIDRGCAPLPVSVNISRCDLFQPGFIDALTGLVKKYDIPFDMLRLEVTESAFAEESGVIVAKVGELIRLGFTVEIDDFGSGYSSLNTLKDVPAGILKLDMKFFENTRNRQRGGNIIESVVRMAKWLGMTVIAEGVEDKEQADYLQTIGCYYIQGYFYAKPMPVDEYEVLLTGSAKEAHLTRLETLTTLDNNEFWNPKSMETLIFNSYVGGACIFEYCDGKSELLRANAQYIRAMGGLIGEGAQLKDSSIVRFLDQDGRDSLVAAINEAIAQRREAFCDVRLSDERHVEYLRVTVRRIARAGERYLFYAVIENMTEQRKAEQKQLESARTLQSVISNVNGSVSAMLLDEIGHSTMIFGNDNYFSLFGYTKEQARAAHLDVMSRIHPDDFSGVVEKLKRLKADGKPVLIDYRGVKRDGSVVEIRSNSSLMRMEGYGDQVIVSVETDITEQRALSDKFRAVIENINGGVSAVYLKEGAPEYAIVNDQYFRIIGYTREQFKAEVASVFDLVHPDDRARVERQFREAGAQRGQYTMEYRFIRRDGAVRHILCNTNVVHLFGVEEPVQLAVSNDITELREAQRKELEAAGKFSAVLNHAGNGITALALNGDKPQFLFMNERYFEIIGYSREEYAAATRDDMAALVHPDDRETIRRRVLSVNESHGSDTIEYRVTRKDGKTIWVRTAVTVTDIPGINAPVQIAVFSDITSQKETAEQLRFLNDSAHDILAQPDSEQAIRDTLQKIVSFFTADRGYVVELDYEKGVSGNTYEVCAPGVRSEMENLRDVPFTKTDFWFGALSRKKYFIIEDVDALGEDERALRDMLRAQGIRSIVLAPLFRDGRMLGFVGADNPSGTTEQIRQLTALADYISILLTRRDLTRKIEHDNRVMQLLMNDTPGGFVRMQIIRDAHPLIAAMNDGFCRMLGMTREEVMDAYGNDAFRCLTAEDIVSASAEAAAALAAHGQFSGKYRLCRKDGSLMWVMMFGRFVTDDGGRLFLNSYLTDISEKKTAEETQIELLDNLPSGAALYEYDGNTVRAIHINNRYWELVGRKRLSEEQISIFGVFHPSDRNGVANELRCAIRQNRDAQIDARIICGDGTYRPFRVTTNNLREENGNYLLYATFVPISDEVMSVQEMLPIALSTLMSSSEDLSYVKDKDQRYICCSQSVADTLGLASARDIIGKTDYDLFDGAIAEKFIARGREIFASGKALTAMLESVPGKGGAPRAVSTSLYPLMDAYGNVVGLYGVSRDITAQKEKESQLELITDTIPGGIASYAIDEGGISLLFFNDGYCKPFGYARDEYARIAAEDPLAVVLGEDKEKIHALIRKFWAEKAHDMTGGAVFRCRAKDGRIIWISLKAVVSMLGDRRSILNVVQLEVTDQIEAENRRMELLDNLPCGAALYAFDNGVISAIHVNKQFVKLVGREADAGNTDYHPFAYVHPDDRKIIFDEAKDAIASGRDGACDVRLICGDGAYHAFHLAARITAKDGGGHLLYVTYSRIGEQELTFRNTLPFIFSTIMESSTDLAFAKDVNFRYLCCSNSFAALLGLKSEKDVVGKTDYELFSPEIAARFRKEDSQLFATGAPRIDVVEPIPSPDGKLHYTRTSKHILRDTTGEIVGVYCVGRDITQTREAFAQLKLLTNSIPGGIVTFRCSETEYHIDYFNDGFCGLFGYTREELNAASSDVMRFIFDEDRAMVDERVASIVRDGTPIQCVYRIHTKDGGYKWVSHNAVLAERVNGEAIINAVFLDITEQQDEKERLRVSEELNRLALNHSGNIITRFSVRDKTLALPNALPAIFDLPQTLNDVPEEQIALGRVSLDTADVYRAMFANISRGEKSGGATYKQNSKKGWRWLKAQYTTVFSSAGRPVTAVISFTDITEQMEKEVVYSKWQQSLTDRPEDSYTLFRCNLSLGASFDTREGKLLSVRFDDAKQTFDERTREYVEQCVYQEDKEKYLSFLNADTMLASYYRGHRSDALEFREYCPDGSVRWLRLSVDLVEYPNSRDIEAYLMFENIDEEKRAELKTIERAETDPLTGILNRATFAARVDEKIAASGSGALHALLMLDIDNFKLVNDVFGHGAGDQALTDVADVLQKGSRRDDLVGRLGGDEFVVFLPDIPDEGAAANRARQICEMTRKTFSADVQVSASVGIALYPRDGGAFEEMYAAADKTLYAVKGTGKNGYAFNGDPLEKAKSAPDRTSPDTRTAALGGRKRRMLIVDDSRVDQALLSGLFRKDFQIEEAMSGGAALMKLRHYGSAISVVLLDLMLPDMDGFAVLAKMRESMEESAIPVVVVSASDERETSLKTIRAGASDYITKPVDPEILRIRVESAISKADNERLRAQNSYLSLQSDEISSYQTVLDRAGVCLMSLDWGKSVFTYGASVSRHLAGTYDGRGLWRILLSDAVADAQTVQRLQRLVHDIADDRQSTEGRATAEMRSAAGDKRSYEVVVYKKTNKYGLTDKLILTFREAAASV